MKIPGAGQFGFRVPQTSPGGPGAAQIPEGAFVTAGGIIEAGNTGMAIAQNLLRKQAAEEDQVRRSKGSESMALFQVGVAGLHADLARRLDEGELTREDAPKEFKKRIDALRKEHIEPMPADLRQAFADNLVKFEGDAQLKLDAHLVASAKKERVATLTGMTEAYKRLGMTDPAAAIEQARAAYSTEGVKLLGADGAEKAFQTFRENVKTGYYEAQALALRGSQQDLEALQARIMGDADLEPTKATQLARSVVALTEKRIAEAQAEQKARNEAATSDLEIAVRRGQAGYRDIEQAYGDGVLTPAKRTQLTDLVDDTRRKAAEGAAREQGMLTRVRGALDGSGFLDFRAEADRDAVDLYYQRVVQPRLQASLNDPGKVQQMIVDFTARTGIVPRPVRGQIRGALRAGGPMERQAAADLLDRIKTGNPAALQDFDAEDIALGNTIATYTAAGVPAAKAVELADKALSVPETERKAREARYREAKAPEANAKKLRKELSGFRLMSASLPDKVPDALAGEYETLVKGEFLRGGDLEVAQKTATDMLKRVWGVTNIDGKPRWSKYAPESVYRVPGEENGKWIREQFLSEIKRGSMFDGEPDLTLMPDSVTAREARPSYVVLLKRDGVYEPMMGSDGKPMRFRPDFATSPAGERRKKALEASRVEDARVLEEERLRRASGRIGPSVSGAVVAP